MRTVIGTLLDRDGMARKIAHGRDRFGALQTRSRQWATPSSEVRQRQSDWIPVDIGHTGSPVGKVVHLERDKSGRLWCVAHVEDRIRPPESTRPLYFSAGIEFNRDDGSDVVIGSVAIVTRSAQSGLLPLQFLDGACDYRGAVRRWAASELDGFRRELCTRACEAFVLERGRPILVHDPEMDYDRLTDAERFIALAEQADAADEPWMHAPMRHSGARGKVLHVR